MKYRPLAIGALYSGIERGLASDVLAARAHGGSAHTVCTSLVSASEGRVTDVLNVPSDSVSAQLEHITEVSPPDAARIGVLGSHQTTALVFEMLEGNFEGPIVLDATLSGPSGEDVVGARGLEALTDSFSVPDVVTLRRLDAERIASQQIDTLSEAQVAAQRIARQGARRVLLRCGSHFEAQTASNGSDEEMNVDLYYDGDDFSLFEAPHVHAVSIHGSSSALTMAALSYRLHGEKTWPAAFQQAKAFTTEALRSSVTRDVGTLDHEWRLRAQNDAS